LHLPEEVNEWFDKCIEFAKNNDEENLLDYCQRIEAWFEFPAASEEVKNAEIPGGMYTNMLAQLKVLKLEHLLEKVLLKVPEVRLAAGCPPLVTPTSQIIGVQAVNVVIDENEGKPPYTKVSNQFFSLVQGQYGKTPIPIDPDFRLKITGVSQEKAYNLDEYKKQENPILKEFGNVKLAENEKEELLLELFPQVAEKFLRTKKERNYNQKIAERKSDEEKKYSQERENFLKLSEEERNKRLQHGLYNYNWKTLV
jgi:pyruvate/oxaloacetate carboxyltransferase